MRSALIALRVTGVAVALTALTAVTTPAAVAEDWGRGGVSVRPDPAEPGDLVKLEVRGCDGGWASARSSVFVSEVHLSSGHDDRHALWGDALIASHAQPGSHEIRVKCDGRDDRVSGSLRIRERHHPDPHHSPVWPVHAGGGAMAAEVAKTTELAAAPAKKNHGGDGPGLPQTVIGAVLAAVATLAVAGRALALRRRRSGE
ncbi:hypothetical protein ABZ934_20905 [Streptomyces sp. NPDC046557]|uniref:hypothetical protein n=1 Tax=Streptomyces sp. NPDC046557 TaxID=3155372 RepID=UPI00340AAEDA